MRTHCTNRLGPRAGTGVTRLGGASPGTTDRLCHSISCRMSRNGNLSYCGMNPALKKNATTLVSNSSVVCPCYCTARRVLSGNPLHFAIGLICGPLAMGSGSSIVRAHLVSLSTNSRVGGAIITCDGLGRAVPITVNVILRRPSNTIIASTTGNCVACISPASGIGGGGKGVFINTTFPTAIGSTGIILFPRGRGGRLHNNTSNRMLTIDSCRPNSRCACC